MQNDVRNRPASAAPAAERPPIPFEAILVGVFVFALYTIPARQLALGWDEGYTFDRLHLLDRWFSDIARSGDWTKLLDRENIARHWRFSKEEPDGHGPFYCLLSLASYKLTSRWIDPPGCYRMGSIALFALAAACVYAALRARFDRGCAAATCGMFVAIPRVVPEVSYALIDGPLFSLAMLAWCAFLRAESIDDDNAPKSGPLRQWLRSMPFGVCIGLAMATKVTGWLLPAPYIAWALITRRGGRVLAVGALVALSVCLLVNLGWWHNPVDGVARFWRSNLTREKTTDIRIQFLGTRYSYALPWYNTLVWTAAANPVGLVVIGAAGIGIAGWRWRRDPLGLLLLLNWSLLMVVRAMPKAPGHDGTRQINISFGFLALLAGYGIARSVGGASAPRRRALVGRLLLAAALTESAVAVARFHPYELSYYGPLVGGLPGAARLGFEPTYFWDSLTDDALGWLNENTPPGGAVLFRNNPTSFDYLSRWGRLRIDHQPRLEPPPTWLVMQMRPGIFTPADDWLVAHGSPAFEKRLDGVLLLAVYRGTDFATAQSAAAQPGNAAPSKPPNGVMQPKGH